MMQAAKGKTQEGEAEIAPHPQSNRPC